MADYLEEAAGQLRKARDSNEARMGGVRSWLSEKDIPVVAEVNQRRMEIADGFIRLAAIERAIPPEEPLLPHGEPELRTAEALGIARDYGTTEGAHHLAWVIDQMVRALTGCPMVPKTGTDHRGEEYSYTARGESDEYLRFVRVAGEWDEGIAP